MFSFKDEIYSSQDLSSAAVNKSGNEYSWTRKDDVKLPENAEKILALQPLVMKYGSKRIPGHAVLYQIDGTLIPQGQRCPLLIESGGADLSIYRTEGNHLLLPKRSS